MDEQDVPSSSGRCKLPATESTLGPGLNSLLLLIKGSTFYADGRLEPTIGSEECDELLANSTVLPFSTIPKLKGKSIYWLFMDEKSKICLLCGLKKGSQGRVLSCVRSDLGHRPFRCPGIDGGCKRCGPDDRFVCH